MCELVEAIVTVPPKEQSEAYTTANANFLAAQEALSASKAAEVEARSTAAESAVAVTAAQGSVTTATSTLANAETDLVAAREQAAADQAAHETAVENLASAQGIFDAAELELNRLIDAGANEQSEAYTTANANFLAAQEALSASKATEAEARSTAAESAVAVTTADVAVENAGNTVATATTALEAALGEAQGAAAATDAAKKALTDLLAEKGIEMDGNTVLIPNVSPDIGDSAPYNSLFTLFGQFFDHGLDLIAKGGSGTVYIPLQPDDPLYVEGSHTNFMALTRAAVPEGENTNVTTPWVDQNQTYTSHPSHQVFLREYTKGPDGTTVATGRLLEGERGLATWADVKAQARDMLGIDLTDANVDKVPLLRTDPYGNFIPDPETGFAQVITGIGPDGVPNTSDDETISGSKEAPVSLANAILTTHAFLDDIAHAAVPGTRYDHDGNPATPMIQVSADADNVAGNQIGFDTRGNKVAYDDELLDAHYITGDGRGNENVGLTTIHHVFHSEHNHLVDQVKEIALTSGDLAFLNEWLLVDVAAIPTTDEGKAALMWDGERLFQAARFTNEMEYQHLVFEEFARKMQPDIDVFVFEPSVDINPAIFSEFAQAVYRFGHSMLNENIDTITVNGQQISMKLFDGFLNPLAFGATDANGDVTVDHEQAAGAIIRGMSRQHANEIDEFVTHVLRNQLVGIPLDLAALNIARGRELGLPSLNEARAQFYQMAGQDSQLKPYVSWTDFALNLQNSLSIVNFIAAYGKHESIVNATTMEAKRAAATLLVLGGTGEPTDRLDFLNSTGAWANKESGLNDVDLWMGGLAEKKMDFGGMLGSTFSFVFEAQLEALQDADRFYYLSRLQGLNLLNELENNSMTDIIMRNTDLGDEGRTALPGNIFSTPDHTLEMIQSKQIGADPVWDNPVLQALSPLVVRKDLDGDGDLDVLIYNGGDHVVIGGTAEDDLIVAGEGDDTVWGYEGNDTIEGGYGVDLIHGGDGDDIITNAGTDIGATDFLHGERGNDVIQGGSGLALIFGNQGQDFIITGPDGKEAFGGTDNDFILGGDGGDLLLGNEGDDWLEGGPRFDTLAGENSELFFNSTIVGHDVLNGGASDTDYDGESGDDIMFQAEGIQRNNGMAGFDWAIHKGDTVAANSDLGIPIFTNQEAFILRDRFDLVEGLSGWKHDDTLTGRVIAVNTRVEATGTAAIPGPNSPIDSFSNALLQKNVKLIDGLDKLVAHLTRIPVVDAAGKPVLDKDGNPEQIVLDTADASDIILGGGGSDTIKGFAGNDIIDGDKWLNVRILITTPMGVYTADGMTGKVYRDTDYAYGAPKQGAVAEFGGKTLDALMLSRTLNPGQLSIVREIVDGDLNNSAKDVAVYGDVRANYVITGNADGSVTVQHVTVTVETDPTTGNNRISDGTDRLFNIETLRFADDQVSLTPPKLSLHAFDAGGTHADNFNQASYSRSTGDRPWTTNWVETGDDNSASLSNDGQIQITSGALRFDQGDGATIQRGLDLAGVASARVTYSMAELGLDNNENVEVSFSKDGASWALLETITGNSIGGNRGFDLSGPFTADAAIRFVVSGINATNEFVNIDNLSISVEVPATTPTVNYATSFTEGGAAVVIASNPGITDDATQMVSARIVLTNAQAGDRLDVSTLPAGITANVTAAAGQIVLNLTGTASLANYQRAIQAVTFDNNSNNPVAGSRVIQVTVNDGLLDSNVATTTVQVNAVNDAPNGINDTIITNIVNGPIVVPEWVLLSNDTDADGPALDIIAASNVSGLMNVSLTANPGSVTFTDPNPAGGSFTYTVSDGGNPVRTDTATVTVTRDTSPIEGTNGNNILIGDGTASTFDGNAGNDTILAGGGDDTIVWNATSSTIFGVVFETSQDGRDFVDGGAGIDTFDVNGNGLSETFRVYSRDAAIDAGITSLVATTEIVITRTTTTVLGGSTTSVIAELDNVEEIIIGTREVTVPGGPAGGSAGGNDTVQIIGNFTGTSLALNTITVNGTGEDDIVDISHLTSAHRIVFRSNGGNDTIVGTLRPQDVIELPAGTVPADYNLITTDGNGVTTMSDGIHSIRFTCENGLPQFGSGDGTGTPGTGTGTPATETPGTGTGTPDTGTPGTGTGTPSTGTPGTGTETPGTGTGTPGTGTPGTGTETPGTGTGTPGTGTPGTGTPGTGTETPGTGTGTPGTGTPDTGTPGTGTPVANIISGTADNDVIKGTAKNDIIFGGEGNDVIDGGSGTDTVLLVGRDRADYSIRFENGNAVFTHKNGGSDGVDTIANVEMIRFTGPDLRAEATLERLYDSILDRAADPAGKSGWLKAHANGMSMHDIAEGLINSAEAGLLHGDMSNEAYVGMLYQSALNRPADQGGLLGWTSALDSRSVDRADVLLSFANSAEKLSSTVIEFDFNQSEAATLVRLYDTVFDRNPDQGGINHWLTANENGMSMHDIALAFIGSTEAQLFRGDMSDEKYVDMLYQGALGRSAETAERTHWVNHLQNGGDRADALLGFANSAEKMALMGVVSTSFDTL